MLLGRQADLQSEVRTLQHKHSIKVSECEKVDGILRKNADKLSQLQIDQDKSASGIEHLKQQVKALQLQFDAMQTQIGRLKHTREESEAHVAKLTSEINKFHDRFQVDRSLIARLENEKTNLEQAMAAGTSKINKLLAQNRSVFSTLYAARHAIQHYLSELNGMTHARDTLNAQLIDSHHEIQRLIEFVRTVFCEN
jgi:chromosome segregation ATPase